MNATASVVTVLWGLTALIVAVWVSWAATGLTILGLAAILVALLTDWEVSDDEPAQ